MKLIDGAKKSGIFYPLFSFFLSMGAFLLFLFFYGVLGPKGYTTLRGDLFVQYIDFISLFLKVLKGEQDFWYSFSLYYGSGTALTYAYYTLNPFHLLYLIENISIPTMTMFIITLKIALSGAAFTLFSQRVLKQSGFFSVFFSLCYAFNSFTITLHFNIIWLDAYFMLPLVILLLYDLLEHGRFLLFTLAWVYLFLTNFYMSYIVGIFTALVFLCLLILRTDHWNKTVLWKNLQKCFLFGWSVFLAAMISAFILLPAGAFLLSHMAKDNFAFSALDTSLPTLLNSMFMGAMPDLDNRQPLLYSGLPVLLLFPFYYFQKTFSLKERLTAGVLTVFYLLSMLVLPLFIFMHAFDYPNWYSFRFSFCLSFLFCTLALRISSVLNAIRFKSLAVWYCFLILLYSIMLGLSPLLMVSWNQGNTRYEFAINLLFLTLWMTLFFLFVSVYHKKHRLHALLPGAALLLLIAEVVTNSCLCVNRIGRVPITRSEYTIWHDAEKEAIDKLRSEDPGLYRISMNGESNGNAPCMFGYAGLNTFSSSDDYALRHLLSSLGIATANRVIQENGYTPLTYMLAGTKYSVQLPADTDGFDKKAEISCLPYSLPFAFLVSPSIDRYAPSDDPFANQEQLIQCMTGRSYHFYDRIELIDLSLSSYNAELTMTETYNLFSQKTDLGSNGYLVFSAPIIEDHPFYACFTKDSATANENSSYVVGDINGLRGTMHMSYGAIVKGSRYLGEEENGYENVSVYLQDGTNDDCCGAMYFARFDPQNLPAVYQDLNSGSLQITQHSSSMLRGTISVTPARPLLLTTIPFDEGWHAYVDGSPAEIRPALGQAFLSIPLSTGEHEILLRYEAPYSKCGAIITICGLLLLIGSAIFSNYLRVSRKKPKKVL